MAHVEGNIPDNAPKDCPGTLTKESGRASACQGCPNQQACLSAPKGPDPDIPIIRRTLKDVRTKILVLSGKGGVGKSTFSLNLAYALSADQDCNVGLLDVDISGPSITRMAGLVGEKIHVSNSGWSAKYVSENLSIMSIGLLLENLDESVIWSGDRKSGLVKQFMRDVNWGALDHMIVDTPPGTSDEHLTISKYLKDGGNAYAIIITTPQELSLQDVRKEINFCKKVGIPIIGVVENMATFVCPNCQHVSEIFTPKTGGAAQMCREMDVPFLGSIPLEPEIARSCDEGEQHLEFFPETQAHIQLLDIAKHVKTLLESHVPT